MRRNIPVRNRGKRGGWVDMLRAGLALIGPKPADLAGRAGTPQISFLIQGLPKSPVLILRLI